MKRFVSGRLILEGQRLRAVLIAEGRSKNGNHWTRAVLEQIAKLAPGVAVNLYDFSKKADRGHLSHWEFIRRRLPPAISRLLPERLEGAQAAKIVSATVEGPEGKAQVVAELETGGGSEGIFQKVLRHAKRLGREVGLSIHVPDDALEGETLPGGDFRPTSVSRIAGFDTVSIPSAGGRILPVLEALAKREDRPMKGWVKRLLRLIPEKQRPALEALVKKLEDSGEKVKSATEFLALEAEELQAGIVEALELDDVDEDALGATLEALVKIAPEEDPPAKKAKAKAKTKTKRRARRPDPTLESDDDDADDDDADADPIRADVDALLVEGGRQTIEAVLEAAELPGELPAFARAQLRARLESDGRIARDDAKSFVDDLKKRLGKSGGGGLLESRPSGIEVSPEWSEGFKAELALEALIAGVPEITAKDKEGRDVTVKAFPGIRRAYAEITGDVHVEGGAFLIRQRRPSPVLESYDWEANPYAMLRRARGLETAVLTTGFPDIITNVINKRLMREYRLLPHVWRRVASTVPVNDFKTRDIHRLGEYANLITVAEGVAYDDIGLPTEEKVTAQIVKRGGLAPITWESIVDDDVRAFRNIPGKLARAADRTLNVSVWGHLLNNDAWDEDSVAFFHASAWASSGHANIVALEYAGITQLEAARLLMTKQKDMDDREAGVVRAASVFSGTSKFDALWGDLMSDRRPILTGTDSNAVDGTPNALTNQNPNMPNWARVRDGLTPYEVHEFDEISGSEDDVILAADPNVTEIMEVGFLNGKEDPEIFVQDLQNVGSFFDNDTITYKVRHVHDGGELVDPRGAVLLQKP